MSKSSTLCLKSSFPRSNIFSTLIDKIVNRPSLQFLRQRGYHCYEPRVYRTLSKILRYVDLEGFDVLLTDYITFVEESGQHFEFNFNFEFTEICINTILYWTFARKGNPQFVELLLKRTKNYIQDRSSKVALIWRTFTPVYYPSPLSGITPLLYVAQSRQSNIFKILLQYGILEREKNPINIVLTILLYPSRVRIMVDHELTDICDDAKTCLVLCSRVLSVIPIREVEAQLHLGRRPIISNWLDYIPAARYKEPCELLHLCRLTIRNQLLTSNMLPNGICSLLIPVCLQDYLNLES
ncbi:ankyrin repeat and SOCS box protein 17 [Tachyglossus aculeatus]|uniref:ankyrin repeat and SOCS box protein 17 n=1 Tax=Tachyglossus aculeatus TaxID=9261 RepID=UPI0018F53BCB|nr:ankyrin repeat and SOCS box protein 17 [Tachyglossus aculeatus]